MTRFDADVPDERRELYAEAIEAHRERASAYATLEADADATDEEEELPPWVQFGENLLNLDCTEAELDALKALLGEFPAFEIDDITRPEEAEGVNVRVSALADPDRIAQCIEAVFRDVYDQPEDFRVWAASV
ncbi:MULTISPECIES: hypothetical protein [Halorussus]|uniref:hypothetical protein n=1 Tax=Halorussus TaxID=1070314 RepID=UPI00209CB362|nr:hypothetical protein [Halorussus vallis]USZ77068.1 hypothetical protein NGM07_07010 [Halorussus vallis]